MPPRFQQFTECSDVVGSDLTAPTNDTRARIKPALCKCGVLFRAQVFPCLEDVDNPAGLQCVY